MAIPESPIRPESPEQAVIPCAGGIGSGGSRGLVASLAARRFSGCPLIIHQSHQLLRSGTLSLSRT